MRAATTGAVCFIDVMTNVIAPSTFLSLRGFDSNSVDRLEQAARLVQCVCDADESLSLGGEGHYRSERRVALDECKCRRNESELDSPVRC